MRQNRKNQQIIVSLRVVDENLQKPQKKSDEMMIRYYSYDREAFY